MNTNEEKTQMDDIVLEEGDMDTVVTEKYDADAIQVLEGLEAVKIGRAHV